MESSKRDRCINEKILELGALTGFKINEGKINMLTKNIKMEEQKELSIKARFRIGKKGKYLGTVLLLLP